MNLSKLFVPLVASLVLLLPATLVEAAPPNIVLVMPDDMGWGDIAAHGNPAAAEYLEGLARKGGNEERRRFALAALAELYEAVERDGDRAGRDRVRETLFNLYDNFVPAREYAASAPRFLAVVPDPGAVGRLTRLLARVRGDGTNREFEVRRALRQCREKTEQAQGK